ncbi:MAG: hypothetical protein DCF19_09305 [Pseudanabaena frigida]|uniref:Uncharacterized protein n=1 Tax=Pseudanabaena frigida TaxID=945775 RepID=A0A2W4WBC3_9CYAN|nr:MAG: hypothetical protein DCF19_09305 [Pseudanabaena frigida]
MIQFSRIECRTAEAIFGDMIDIYFGGQRIWEGPVNTNGTYDIAQSRRIPQGRGAQIVINQWYFGQWRECVYTSPPVRRTDIPGEQIHSVDPTFDGDPKGEYVLYVVLEKN